jgi:hypothetical protein
MSTSKIIFLVFCLAIFSNTRAQNSYNDQLWLDVNYSSFISPKSTLVGDLGFRHQFDQPNWNQLILRPGIKYSLSSNWKLLGGIGYFDKFNQSQDDDTELRFYQGVLFKLPFSKSFAVENYFRLEERFFTNDAFIYSFRLRNQVTVEYNLVNKVQRKISIPLSCEAFFDLDEITAESFQRSRLRFYTGIDYRYYDRWRVVALYNFQGNKGDSNDNFSRTEVMYRIRFYIYFRKSSSFK